MEISITLNGQKKTLKAPLNLEDFLAQEGYKDMTIAIARNGSFVPKKSYSETALRDGDDIEIVAPMQGG